MGFNSAFKGLIERAGSLRCSGGHWTRRIHSKFSVSAPL